MVPETGIEPVRPLFTKRRILSLHPKQTRTDKHELSPQTTSAKAPWVQLMVINYSDLCWLALRATHHLRTGTMPGEPEW